MNLIPKKVGLMTQPDSVSRPIRFKNSDQTFSGTQTVSHKTCVKIGRFLGFRQNGWLDATADETDSIRSQAGDRVKIRLKHSRMGSGWPRIGLGRDGRLLLVIHRGHGHSVTGRIGIQEPVGNRNNE